MTRNAPPLSPVALAQRTMDSVHDTLEGSFDPLGMSAPILHAHLAWMAHPQELASALGAFSVEAWGLGWHTWKRVLGVSDLDPVRPNTDDDRFRDTVWTESASWDIVKEWYLAVTRHMQDMLYSTPGLSGKERRRAAFWWRKWLNALAPTNFFWSNPVAMKKALESHGESLLLGWQIFMEDMQAGTIRMSDTQSFEVGGNLATTPGSVVFRNRLLEVIHYAPTQPDVHAEPVVIVTPWINKFYILDLNARKSMVRYLLDQGLDVFITSWKNPDESMAEVGFDEYLSEGVQGIIETARAFCQVEKVHAVGYCIGGTALSMYMAWANRTFAPEDVPVRDVTLFTTLVDFARPGDIEVFIDEASVRYLTNSMASRGYLDGKEMAAAFRLLRSNSLIWHYLVHGWLYGERPTPFDVLYWNMDSTRMPYKMHSWYLEELYLKNRLIDKDALTVAGQSLDLSTIAQPLYVVGAEDDHIAPWKQTFRINNFAVGKKRYVLSSSGHILGIVNPPVKPPKRQFWVGEAHRSDTWEQWRTRAEEHDGSWWEDWMHWLKPGCGELVDARPAATEAFPELCPAPGSYVVEP